MRAAGSPGKPARRSSLPRAGGWQGSPAPFLSRGGARASAVRFAEGDGTEATALEREDLNPQAVPIDDVDARVAVVRARLDDGVAGIHELALALSLPRQLPQWTAGAVD